ncbi:MAG: leucine-rich repeat domain-containing protein [Promethearchaeota archaeon]
MVEENKLIVAFISYSMSDSKWLHVSEIANELGNKSMPIKVHYWEGCKNYQNVNIFNFMNVNIEISDIFIPICTESSIKANYCVKGQEIAVTQKKKIIPLFERFQYVPTLFQSYKGVNIKNKTINQITDELYLQIISIMSEPPTEVLVIYSESQEKFNYYQTLGEHFLQNNKYQEALTNFQRALKACTSASNVNVALEVKNRIKYVEDLIRKKKVSGLVLYRGQRISASEKKVLSELEGIIKEAIPSISMIDSGYRISLGFVAREGHVIALSIPDRGLTEIPSSIGTLKYLKKLNLNDNRIIALPVSFSKLKLLTELMMRGEQLRILPKFFFELPNLKRLDLLGCELDIKSEELLIQLWNKVRIAYQFSFFEYIPKTNKFSRKDH